MLIKYKRRIWNYKDNYKTKLMSMKIIAVSKKKGLKK